MRTELPEFPKDRRARYVAELGLSDYDANQLTATKVTSDFFEAAVALGGDAKQVSNWLQGEVAQFSNRRKAKRLRNQSCTRKLGRNELPSYEEWNPFHLRLPRKSSFIWRKTVAVRVNTSKKPDWYRFQT